MGKKSGKKNKKAEQPAATAEEPEEAPVEATPEPVEAEIQEPTEAEAVAVEAAPAEAEATAEEPNPATDAPETAEEPTTAKEPAEEPEQPAEAEEPQQSEEPATEAAEDEPIAEEPVTEEANPTADEEATQDEAAEDQVESAGAEETVEAEEPKDTDEEPAQPEVEAEAEPAAEEEVQETSEPAAAEEATPATEESAAEENPAPEEAAAEEPSDAVEDAQESQGAAAEEEPVADSPAEETQEEEASPAADDDEVAPADAQQEEPVAQDVVEEATPEVNTASEVSAPSSIDILNIDLATLTAAESFRSFQLLAQRAESETLVSNLESFLNVCTQIDAPVQAMQIQGYLGGLMVQLDSAGEGVWYELLQRDGGEQFVTEGVEKYLMNLLYSQCLHASATAKQINDHLDLKLRVIRSLMPLPIFENSTTANTYAAFDLAKQELRRANDLKAPRDKLATLRSAVEHLRVVGSESGIADGDKSEGFLLLLVLSVVEAATPNLYASVKYAQEYREPSLVTPEDRQVLTLMEMAVEWLVEASADDLTIEMGQDAFDLMIVEELEKQRRDEAEAARIVNEEIAADAEANGEIALEGEDYPTNGSIVSEDAAARPAKGPYAPTTRTKDELLEALNEKIHREENKDLIDAAAEAKGDIAELRSIAAAADAAAAALSERVASTEQALETLEPVPERLAAAEDSLVNLRNTTLMLKQLQSDQKEETDAAVGRITQLEEEAAAAHETVGQLQETVAANDVATKNGLAGLQKEIFELRETMDELNRRVDRALQLEQLPPKPDIPDGPKVRLLIALISGGTVVKEILVPISQNASIRDLKCEALRRLRQQGIVDERVAVPSKAVLTDDANGVVFFEEDSLEDCGVAPNERVRLEFVSKLDVHSAPTPVIQPPPMPAMQPQAQQFVAPAATAAPNVPPPMPDMQPTAANTIQRVEESNVAPPPQLFGARKHTDVTALHEYVLPEEVVADLLSHESLERRLQEELCRMELEPLAKQEELCRIQLYKNEVNAVRNRLVDRATYSQSEVQRQIARGALVKLNMATDSPTVTITEMVAACRVAEQTVAAGAPSAGEENRVQMLEDSAKLEVDRKGRAVDSMKELIDVIQRRIRIPDHLMSRAEQLINSAETAIILAPSSSREELDAVVANMEEFVSACKK